MDLKKSKTPMKTIIKSLAIAVCVGFATEALAQDDLMDAVLQEANETKYEQPAFKAMKIGNLQSTKVADKGDWYMYVSHRFGTLKDGVSTFFGLDNANTKIQMIYAPLNGVQLGISRESIRKTYAGSAKIRIVKQGPKSPVHLVAYSTVNVNTQLDESRYPKLIFEDRLSYATQLLVARRLTNRLSLELAPTYVRQNLVLEKEQEHDQFAVGIGGRFKLTKRLSINADYAYLTNRYEKSAFNDPITLGLDLETGGHVFQLLFSNAQSTNEPGFLTNAEGDWSKGNVFFGFNIVRVF